MMKSRILALISAAMLSLSLMTACSKNEPSSESSSAAESSISSSQEESGKSESKSGPVLSISNAEAKAGEIVDVSVSIKGAELKWSMCGIHLTYDNRLECVPLENDPTIPDYEMGEAIKKMMAFVALIGGEDMPEELTNGGSRGCLFFTTTGEGDCGRDGTLVTFKFKVPDDAKPGDVYELAFYNREGDMFSNAAGDEDFQNQVLSNWESGSITVV